MTMWKHDRLCESVAIDIGVGDMGSPCGCLERAYEKLVTGQHTPDRREQDDSLLSGRRNSNSVASRAEVERALADVVRATERAPEELDKARTRLLALIFPTGDAPTDPTEGRGVSTEGSSGRAVEPK